MHSDEFKIEEQVRKSRAHIKELKELRDQIDSLIDSIQGDIFVLVAENNQSIKR